MQTFIIHYGEIGLKGGNRRLFEQKLIKNIKQQIKPTTININQKQIVLAVKSSLINQTIAKLKAVFGIVWFAPVTVSQSALKSILPAALNAIKGQKFASFAVRAHRINKSLPFTSQDVAVKVGEQIRSKTKAKVDLTFPEMTIYVNLHADKAYIYTQKISGPGGLPVGTSGKVLSLLSGGFDSIAASYLLAKRGAQVDFLHFHVFSDPKKVLTSKIHTIIKTLQSSTLSSKLFLSGYIPYQMSVLDLPQKLQKQELIVFRRLMVKVGESLAQKHGYQALILGDSLGQVASQTLENIVAVDKAVDIPIFRPLIGMDKNDIIALVRRLDLETVTNQPYKDCCSIVSKKPAIKVNLNQLNLLEDKINFKKITDEVVNQTQTIIL